MGKEEAEGPAKGEAAGGRKPHARFWCLAYVHFLNVYETKGDQVQTGVEIEKEASQRSRHLQAVGVISSDGFCRKAQNNVDPKGIQSRN